MSENSLTQAANLSPVIQEIKTVLDDARRNVAVQVNNEQDFCDVRVYK